MNRHEGMTLIEALIAIAILSVVMTLIFGGFSQTTKVKERVEMRNDREHFVRLAMERLGSDISSAFVSAQVNPSESLQVVRTAFIGRDRGNRDRLDFCAFSGRHFFQNTHESDQQEISYFLARHPENPSLKVLARREQPRIDDQPERGGTVQIVLEDVVSLDFKYLDPMSNEWLSGWDTTQGASQPNRLPTQVKIILGITDPDKPNKSKIYATRAMVRIPYGLNQAIYNP